MTQTWRPNQCHLWTLGYISYLNSQRWRNTPDGGTDIARTTTDLGQALANKADTIYFDALTMVRQLLGEVRPWRPERQLDSA